MSRLGIIFFRYRSTDVRRPRPVWCVLKGVVAPTIRRMGVHSFCETNRRNHRYKMSHSGLAPERVLLVDDPAPISALEDGDLSSQQVFDDMQFIPGDSFNQLRPELIESLYYLNYYTGDPKYVEWGKEIFDSFIKHSKAEHGFSMLEGLEGGGYPLRQVGAIRGHSVIGCFADDFVLNRRIYGGEIDSRK